MWVSIALQSLIGLANIKFGKRKLFRKAQPELVQDLILWILVVVSAILTAARIPIFVASVRVEMVAAILFVLALLPPVLGLAENRCRGKGEIFDPGRFVGHITGNLTGAATAAGFYWAAQNATGFIQFTRDFTDASAFNIALPVTTLIIFAFVREQQIERCADLDEMVLAGKDWKSQIKGYSLTDWNQLSNCIFLISATFAGSSTILYLFSYSLLGARDGTPVAFSVQLGLAMFALVGFLLVCGSPLSWNNRTVYFTFLTGMPGALVAIMLWLALLQPSAARTIFAVSFVSVGYILYCAAVIVGSLRRTQESGSVQNGTRDDAEASAQAAKETIELHYFAAAILGAALTLLMGVLYLTHTGG